MNLAPLVETTRGAVVESIHFGSVAVVNTRGDLLYYAGDPEFLTFTRSTLKPFQAVPFLSADGPGRFGYTMPELALLCASHSGEPMHVDAVQSMLRKAGCEERHLRCGCHEPIFYSATGQQRPASARFNQLHHNCSGKHAGFLAYCVQHGLPLDSYLDPGSRLQQDVRKCVAHFSGMAETDLKAGIDGCSAPNYAMPLSRLAVMYGRLAMGAPDAVYGDALADLFQAMTTHPEMVSGTGRVDLALMQTALGDCVAKAGAEGVQGIGIRSAGLGIAIKIADGNSRALHVAVTAVLQQLGLVTSPEKTPLAPWVRPRLNNYRNLHTGEIRAVVRLVKA